MCKIYLGYVRPNLEYLFIYSIIFISPLTILQLTHCSETVCLIWAAKKENRTLHINEKKRRKVIVKKLKVIGRWEGQSAVLFGGLGQTPTAIRKENWYGAKEGG